MSESPSTTGLEVLPRESCLRLLDRGGVGRLALPGDPAPEIRPVNFARSGERLVIRTGPGRILQAARDGAPAAFEIDGIDKLEHSGWSVIATGRLVPRSEPADTRDLRLRAWAAGDRDHFVELTLERLSGRRIAGGGSVA